MTVEEFNTYKELENKFHDVCQKYIEKRETFDEPNYDIEEDTNEWNFVVDFNLWDEGVDFVIDTNGYKYEGERYIKFVPIDEILND